MKRTAVLISGMPREVDQVWKSFKDHVLNYLPNADVFIYSGGYYPVDERFFEQIKPKLYMVEPAVSSSCDGAKNAFHRILRRRTRQFIRPASVRYTESLGLDDVLRKRASGFSTTSCSVRGRIFCGFRR
jgi:hypothetical protein